MKEVIKGENYTEIRYSKPNGHETIQHWHLKKERKPIDCGIWLNGMKLISWEAMMEVREK